MIEKHGCLRMLDDLKNGRLRALIQPHRGQGVKEARAAYPTHYEGDVAHPTGRSGYGNS